MKLIKILHKNYPIWVRRFKISDLNLELCSHKFKIYLENHPCLEEVFVKCNKDETFNMRLKKNDRQEYRIYCIIKHETIIEPIK